MLMYIMVAIFGAFKKKKFYKIIYSALNQNPIFNKGGCLIFKELNKPLLFYATIDYFFVTSTIRTGCHWDKDKYRTPDSV